MSVEITVTGMDFLKNMASKYPAVCQKYIDVAILQAIGSVDAYQRGGSAMTPVRTANLKNNWTPSFSPFQGTLKSNAYYGIFVNAGTGRMRANPFWDRTLSAQKENVNTIFQTAISGIIKELGQ